MRPASAWRGGGTISPKQLRSTGERRLDEAVKSCQGNLPLHPTPTASPTCILCRHTLFQIGPIAIIAGLFDDGVRHTSEVTGERHLIQERAHRNLALVIAAFCCEHAATVGRRRNVNCLRIRKPRVLEGVHTSQVVRLLCKARASLAHAAPAGNLLCDNEA